MNHEFQNKSEKNALPTHIVKARTYINRTVKYEKIGAAWVKDDEAIYVKLSGVQIVSEGFTLYPIDREKG